MPDRPHVQDALERALRLGASVEQVSEASGIDGWFVEQVEGLVALRGEQVAVVDVRKPEDHARGSVPGSLHFDAYDAMNAGLRRAMEEDPKVVLMGEDVESRRSFIQRNARDVRFLDI